MRLFMAERDQLIYDTYLAQQGLLNEIRKNGNDLSDFMDKNPSEIIEKLGKERLMKMAPARSFVLELVHKKYIENDFLNALDNPQNLVLQVRKKEMANLRRRKIKERREIIFDMYVNYILKKKFPDLSEDKYEKAKLQELNNLSWSQKNNLQTRVNVLFDNKELSGSLSDTIDEKLSSHHIPTEDDVTVAENISIPEGKGLDNVEVPYIPNNGKPILVYPADYPGLEDEYKKYLDFSPIAVSSTINIDGKNFPTISHYISYRLISAIPGVDRDKSFQYLLRDPNSSVHGLDSFLSPDDIAIKYKRIVDTKLVANMKKYVSKGMSKKFENKYFQNLLLATGKNDIIYVNQEDPVLARMASTELKKLRLKYEHNPSDSRSLELLSASHVATVMDEDIFVKEWVHMRKFSDMCKILILMKMHLYGKDNANREIDASFARTVLDSVYQPCSHIYESVGSIKSRVPMFFSIMVKKCWGFKNVGDDIVEIIWKRISVLIYFLIKHMEVSTLGNIRAVIAQIELMVTRGGECVDIVPDKNDNCIISALINLLRGISIFNKKFSSKSSITSHDVKTAEHIILNTIPTFSPPQTVKRTQQEE